MQKLRNFTENKPISVANKQNKANIVNDVINDVLS